LTDNRLDQRRRGRRAARHTARERKQQEQVAKLCQHRQRQHREQQLRGTGTAQPRGDVGRQIYGQVQDCPASLATVSDPIVSRTQQHRQQDQQSGAQQKARHNRDPVVGAASAPRPPRPDLFIAPRTALPPPRIDV
jgi:hypothetical protein